MGNRFKPFTLFLCLLIIAFLIIGPRVIENNTEIEITRDRKNKPEEEWRGVITVWDYPRPYPEGGSGYGWIRGKIREFESKNPGVFIELHKMDWQQGSIQMDLAVKTGTYPDIAPVGTNFGYAEAGLLEALDEYYTPEVRSKYMEYAIKAVIHRDRIWGIPLYGASPVLLLNLEIFNKLKVEPPPDGRWTYDEFVETLKRLTVDTNGDGKTDIYGFHSFIQNGYTDLYGLLLSDGWELYDHVEGRYSINTPDALSGLNKLVALARDYGVVPDDFGVSSPDEAWLAFASRRNVAVHPAGLWALGKLELMKNEGKGFEYMIAEYPIGKTGIPVTVSEGVAAYGLFVQRDAGKREMCIRFLNHLVQGFDANEIRRRNVIPVRKDQVESYAPLVEPDTIKVIPKMNNWVYIEDILNSHIRQAVLGKETPEEALKRAQSEIDSLRGQP
ncbi:MAG: ABC transporter, substrate-binding protein (cluster 1, maltose/g3p/polyamine/iron) [Firmicutes bacterium]|nr:ABC transporter, substrate-binding protein (cluster 1, maltose/g3p/polyamine/iron) [Bacillota bacterium]MDI6704862.1 extracellular solute-binding protein [Bacillota bacterium]